ncbi:hypothetical protein B2J93_3561 [Marssonina coronariae]|uniref:Amidase domain-containing protein n=1 Tax=Diplocarpon coronariae TaxID=2795749 RepID=A0A218Z4F8_9HELO|nr:hypothetical protein B2J93_3561 [Marssonina coronariae]
MSEPYRLTASEALPLLKSGELTVEGYARSLLARIKLHDHVVKAWAFLDPEFVLEQARKLDQVPAGERGPLHGIPVGVKDVIFTRDMPTAFNSVIYKDRPVQQVDAACIITLRASGALIFGKTTTTEFAVTTNGGPSTNPHDETRTPGGSSSGSGAAVGDFQVPIALGTQTGGSTVRPGSYNGIYGFKLSDDTPIPSTPFLLRGAKVAFAKTHVWPGRAGPGLKAAFEKAKALLEDQGARVEEIELPEEFSKISEWHGRVCNGEGRASFLGNYLLAKDKLDPLIQGQVENASKLPRKAQLEAYDGCARLRPVWDDIASTFDAVLTPSVPDEAPLGIASTGDASFCSMWTILHVPALNIPGFAGENGMPIGLTLVGARYHDEYVLQAGKAIGEVFGREGGFESKIG